MLDTLPNPKDVRDFLGDLLGRDVTVSVVDAWAPLPVDAPCAAEYLDDTGQLRAVVVADLPLAVHLGAAIGLVPPGGAKDMVAERSPGAMVLANLAEVLNIVAALFNVGTNPHVRLTGVHDPGAPFPSHVAEAARTLAGRLDLEVDVAGYGGGRLALIGL